MIPIDAQHGAYSPAARLCTSCGTRLERPRKHRLPKTSLCHPCYAKQRAISNLTPRPPMTTMPGLLGVGVRIPRARRLPSPIRVYPNCCGPMLAILHDPKSERHRIGWNSFMREYERARLHAYYRYHLGTVSQREELPSALVELAVTRRRLQEATKQVGNWRTNGQVDDPS